MTILKYGKHRGEDIRDVPADYLDYLIAAAEQTILDCKTELGRREKLRELVRT